MIVSDLGVLIECEAVEFEKADMQLVLADIGDTALPLPVDHRLAFEQMVLESTDLIHRYMAEPGVTLDYDDQVPGRRPGRVVEQAVIGLRHSGCRQVTADAPFHYA